jgi:protoheme IX farnesyltransferase
VVTDSRHRLREFFALTKPRVLSLIVFTAVIGMMLAAPGLVPLRPLVFGAMGIAMVAGAAAATNCLLEWRKDAVMARTRARPLPRGRLSPAEAAAFAVALGAAGLALLYTLVNPLTMWLTLATFASYAFIYTLLLKPRTPQNIVLGGAAGAMPPLLGWTAVTGEVSFEALLLFLIIFVWTPPHFWSLALYRRNEYAKAGVPMLPVTHGMRYTQRQVLLYTLGLVAITLLPFCTHMSGLFYSPARRCWARSSSRTPSLYTATIAIGWRARPSATRSPTSRFSLPHYLETTTYEHSKQDSRLPWRARTDDAIGCALGARCARSRSWPARRSARLRRCLAPRAWWILLLRACGRSGHRKRLSSRTAESGCPVRYAAMLALTTIWADRRGPVRTGGNSSLASTSG